MPSPSCSGFVLEMQAGSEPEGMLYGPANVQAVFLWLLVREWRGGLALSRWSPQVPTCMEMTRQRPRDAGR